MAAHADDKPQFVVSGGGDVKIGSEFDVTISISMPGDGHTLGDYNLSLAFDSSKVEYYGAGGTGISGSGDKNIKLHFKAVGEGTSNISFDYSNDNAFITIDENKITGSDIGSNADFKATNINVVGLSGDSSLKSLKIPNGTLDPAFKSDVYSYKTTVTDVTAIDINATPNNGGAQVSITPNYKDLKKGDQDVSIVVTAENGAQTTYTIKVTLKTTPTPEEIKLADATLKNLTVKGEKLEFNKDEKKYYLTVNYDTKKLVVNATPNNEKAEVKIIGNDKLIVGKNTIKISVTSEDKTKTETYQIIVTRNAEEKEIVETCPDTTSTNEWIIFTVCMLLTFSLGIVLGYFLCKKEVLKKLFKKKKEEEPVAIETLSDTIDLSDTIKQTKKEVKKETKK